jgi:hypothetical protein
MGFGALYLLACSAALVELYRFTASFSPSQSTPGQQHFLKVYLLTMVVLAWAAVLTGAYVIYPWYRAVPPPGTTDSLDVSATSADVQPDNYRLALSWDGMEGAYRVVRSYFDHDGCVCLY